MESRLEEAHTLACACVRDCHMRSACRETFFQTSVGHTPINCDFLQAREQEERYAALSFEIQLHAGDVGEADR